ncbi:MAG TPA: hypothetical protein VKV04_10195 [Verrucomicrobiae bacterium]|nr:hypothetical protein [Verrucomicrobiae bacterium]
MKDFTPIFWVCVLAGVLFLDANANETAIMSWPLVENTNACASVAVSNVINATITVESPNVVDSNAGTVTITIPILHSGDLVNWTNEATINFQYPVFPGTTNFFTLGKLTIQKN